VCFPRGPPKDCCEFLVNAIRTEDPEPLKQSTTEQDGDSNNAAPPKRLVMKTRKRLRHNYMQPQPQPQQQMMVSRKQVVFLWSTHMMMMMMMSSSQNAYSCSCFVSSFSSIVFSSFFFFSFLSFPEEQNLWVGGNPLFSRRLISSVVYS